MTRVCNTSTVSATLFLSGADGQATASACPKYCGNRIGRLRKRTRPRKSYHRETSIMPNQTNSRPLSFALTLLSALGRLVPHAPNVTPLGGSCLFAGSRVSGLWAYLLPLAVMLATDPFVGGFTAASPMIYACFLIDVWI